jgi:aminoglycoside phosphotransferase (APT) family kinase protein
MSDLLAERLQAYLAEKYPGSLTSDLKFLVSGFESDVYTFALQLPGGQPGMYVLRMYPGEGAVLKMTRESRGLDLLHQAGYPVPAMLIYEADPAILGKPFTILEKLEGGPLWPVLAGAAPAQAYQLLDWFSATLARLHQLDWRPFTEQADLFEGNPASVLDEWLDSSRQLYTRFNVRGFLDILDWLDAHRGDVVFQPAVVHLDFHANNVFLCADGSMAVLDWTQIGVSDYRTDLSWTLMIMGDMGHAGWGEHILQAYSTAAGKPVEDLDYFNVIAYTKLLGSTVISLRTSPKELGLRPETIESARQLASILKLLSGRIQRITGLNVPEVEMVLANLHWKR